MSVLNWLLAKNLVFHYILFGVFDTFISIFPNHLSKLLFHQSQSRLNLIYLPIKSGLNPLNLHSPLFLWNSKYIKFIPHNFFQLFHIYFCCCSLIIKDNHIITLSWSSMTTSFLIIFWTFLSFNFSFNSANSFSNCTTFFLHGTSRTFAYIT